MLESMLDQLHRCQKALNEFLEEKRSKYEVQPRIDNTLLIRVVCVVGFLGFISLATMICWRFLDRAKTRESFKHILKRFGTKPRRHSLSLS